MKKFLTKDNIVIGTAIIIALIIITFLSIGLFNIEKNRYNECVDNPPTINYVEEDLEDVFITKNVEVLSFTQEQDICFYIVKANGLYYKVVYYIDTHNFFSATWKYSRYIPISESEALKGMCD